MSSILTIGFYGNQEGKIINFFHRIYLPFARLALFIVYFWFGALKAADISPATPLGAGIV